MRGVCRLLKSKFREDSWFGLKMIMLNLNEIAVIKSLYYNFVALPLRKAIYFPIVIGRNAKIRKIGKIELCEHIYPGMLSIGVNQNNVWECSKDATMILYNEGLIHICGRVWLYPGVKVYVKKNAELRFGHQVKIGNSGKIICYKGISFGDNVRISWECQIFDTDFHFLKNIVSVKHYPRTRPVSIEDNVFVGNRTTIGKGTLLTYGSVVSCCSKVNDDFSHEGSNLLIMGSPARVVKKGVEMGNSWDIKEEEKVAKEIEGS